MAGWFGAIVGAVAGLALSPYATPLIPAWITGALGTGGSMALVAIIGAWAGAILADVFGIATDNKR